MCVCKRARIRFGRVIVIYVFTIGHRHRGGALYMNNGVILIYRRPAYANLIIGLASMADWTCVPAVSSTRIIYLYTSKQIS